MVKSKVLRPVGARLGVLLRWFLSAEAILWVIESNFLQYQQLMGQAQLRRPHGGGGGL